MINRILTRGAALLVMIVLALLAFTVPDPVSADGVMLVLAGAPMLFTSSLAELEARLRAAGTFAEPGSDLLADINGLSAEDIRYVVDSTNPFEQISPGGLLGDTLFPERRTEELTFAYLKGAAGGAVMAHVTAHNSEAPLVGRRGVETVRGQIPAIKQKRYQDALTLIRLQSNDVLIQSAAVREIFDDVSAARLGIAARVEKLRMDALATGVASQLTEEGLVYSVNYGVPGGHQETLAGADLWTDAASTPLADLEEWQNTMVADTGQQMATAVTSTAVIAAVRKHETVRKAIWGVNSDRPVTRDQLNAFLGEQGLPTFVAYDLMVQQEAADGTRTGVRLWPANRVTLIPALAGAGIGRTHRAPTAEEAVQAIAEGVIVVDGFRIATHVYVNTNDPKGVVTLGVASTFPSFERADHVFQAQVLA